MNTIRMKYLSALVIFCLQFSAGVALSSQSRDSSEDENPHTSKRFKSEESGAIEVAHDGQNLEVAQLIKLPYGLIRKIGLYVANADTVERGRQNLVHYMLTSKKINGDCRGRTYDSDNNPVYRPQNHLMFMYMMGYYQHALAKFNSFPEVLPLVGPNYEETSDIGDWILDESTDAQQKSDFIGSFYDTALIDDAVRSTPDLLEGLPTLYPAARRLVEFIFWFDACCRKIEITDEDYDRLDKVIGYASIPAGEWESSFKENQIHWQVKSHLRSRGMSNITFIPLQVSQFFPRISGFCCTEDALRIDLLRYVAPIFSLMPNLNLLAFDDFNIDVTRLPRSTRFCTKLEHLSLQYNSGPTTGVTKQYLPLPTWIARLKNLELLNLEGSDYILNDLSPSLQSCRELFITDCKHNGFPYWWSNLPNLELLIINTSALLPLLSLDRTGYNIEILDILEEDPALGDREEIADDQLSELQRLIKDNTPVTMEQSIKQQSGDRQ